MTRGTPNPKILYNSADLHNAIKQILGSPSPADRRVAIVAYVGASGDAFLPNPQGLEIICSLEPGATSAEALIRLRKLGAVMRQSDRLYMKVYWSNRKGAVICSANASSNALGKGGLKEAGVWVPSEGINIKTLLDYANPRPITDRDLRELAHMSDLIHANDPRPRRRVVPESNSIGDWLESKGSKPWKLGWWDSRDTVVAKVAKAESVAQYGVRDPHDCVQCGKTFYKKGDWVLQFSVVDGRSASWMYVDFVVQVPSSDKRSYSKAYPYQAIQVHSNSRYPIPPFKLDPHARKAISKAVQQFGNANIENLKTALLPKLLRQLLVRHSSKG